MNKVSVVIPTYNRATTLPRAIQSVLAQTQPVHEILVCDDGSNDHSKEIVASFKDKRIRWLDCGRNGMPSVPRNKGIKEASGDWIAFLDSDDEWLPEKISEQLKALSDSGLKASATNCNRWVEGRNLGPFFKHHKKAIQFEDLLPVNMNICSSVMIARNILLSTSLFPEDKEYKAIEDYALWLRIATATSFCYVEEALVNYYDDPAASIRSDSNSENALRKIIFSGFTQWIKEKNIQIAAANTRKLATTIEKINKGGQPTLWERLLKRIKRN